MRFLQRDINRALAHESRKQRRGYATVSELAEGRSEKAAKRTEIAQQMINNSVSGASKFRKRSRKGNFRT